MEKSLCLWTGFYWTLFLDDVGYSPVWLFITWQKIPVILNFFLQHSHTHSLLAVIGCCHAPCWAGVTAVSCVSRSLCLNPESACLAVAMRGR